MAAIAAMCFCLEFNFILNGKFANRSWYFVCHFCCYLFEWRSAMHNVILPVSERSKQMHRSQLPISIRCIWKHTHSCFAHIFLRLDIFELIRFVTRRFNSAIYLSTTSVCRCELSYSISERSLSRSQIRKLRSMLWRNHRHNKNQWQ